MSETSETAASRCQATLETLKALIDCGNVSGFSEDLVIAHAWICPDGIPYVDAWVREGNQIYQPAMYQQDGSDVVLQAELKDFLEYARPTEVHEYRPEEVEVELERHGHCGPWHPSLTNTLRVPKVTTYTVTWHKPFPFTSN